MKTVFLATLILMVVGIVMGQKKTEKQAIIETIGNIFSGVDERNWTKVQSAMASGVYLDYTSLAGGNPATLKREAIIESWKGVLPGFQSTHHQIGNFQVNIEGNQAEAKFSGLALHYLNGESWTVVGTYEFALTKNSNGEWSVKKMKLNLQKQDGNLQLPALATQNVKNGVNFKAAKVSAENKKVVENFFGVLESLDIQAFMKVWADDAKQIMPLAPNGFPRELDGKEAIFNQYKGLPENFTAMNFPRQISATENPNKIIVKYNGIIPLKTGGEYNNNYVGIFEIKNGKIEKFTEYFDPFILENAFGKKLQDNFNVKTANVSRVEFKSEGLILRGNLHLPENFDESKKYEAVVVAGSWTTVKEQMPDLYAAKFAKDGLIALSFDFRNYGESEGQPRNYENPAMKTQDLINAVNYLRGLKFVDSNNINGVGICASAGYLVTAAADGAKFKSISLVAPWLQNAEIVAQVYGANREFLLAKAIEAKKKFAETGKVDYVLGASSTDNTAAMFGPIDYYLNPKRGAIKEWGNQFAVMAWQDWLEFDAIKTAENIKIPVQIIHSKTAAVPQGAETFYAKLNVPKNIIWVENATQFDFYDGETQVNNAVKETVKWFAKN